MTETLEVKRKPGRPRNKAWSEGVKGDDPIESLPEHRILTGESVDGKLPIDSKTLSRIAVCNDIKFVLRGEFGRRDFDASFLKKGHVALPKELVTPEFVGCVKMAQSLKLVCKVRKVSPTLKQQGETMSASDHDADWLREWV